LDALTSSTIAPGVMPAAFRKPWYPSVRKYPARVAESGFPKRRESTLVSSGLGSLYGMR
jgi:hypothetical protein